MKLFVTGGTGFIGSHFLQQALAGGHEVRALRRPGGLTRIPLAVEPEWLDVSFDRLESQHFAGIEAVVHLAAHSANVPYDSLENCLHWNVTVPLRMADKAWGGGVRRFVVAGSCFEYGRSGERYERIPPDAPLEPTQSYPISKAAASVAWQGFARERNVSVSIARVFQVYGEGEPAGRLWPAIRAAALAGADYPMTAGEQIRDFVEVGEVARQLMWQTKNSEAALGAPRVLNVGTGHPKTVREFAERIWADHNASGRLLLGAIPYRANEIMRYVPQIG